MKVIRTVEELNATRIHGIKASQAYAGKVIQQYGIVVMLGANGRVRANRHADARPLGRLPGRLYETLVVAMAKLGAVDRPTADRALQLFKEQRKRDNDRQLRSVVRENCLALGIDRSAVEALLGLEVLT